MIKNYPAKRQTIAIKKNLYSEGYCFKLNKTNIPANKKALFGCNTVAGVGKDVERGGEKVQDAAKNQQKKM